MKLSIYDPAMCCSSGVCGTDVDEKLVQLANFLKKLEGTGVEVERYNLSQQPKAYVENLRVANEMNRNGVEVLPLFYLDNQLIFSEAYPSIQELEKALGCVDFGSEGDATDCCSDSGCCS